MARWLFAVMMACALAGVAAADMITFSGNITQSTSDGTGPAANNLGLNNIQDNDAFSVILNFLGSIPGPGTYPLPTFSLLFHDPTASVDESSFNSVSVSVLTDGSFFDISMFGCLTTGSTGCLGGNSLSAIFKIPVGGLHSQNVAAQPLPSLLPLDLLEDDAGTDIHGTVSTYSYTGASAVPEPSAYASLTLILAAMVWLRRRMKQAASTH